MRAVFIAPGTPARSLVAALSLAALSPPRVTPGHWPGRGSRPTIRALPRDLTVDDYLALASNEDAAALFRRFQVMVEACGPSDVSVSRTIVFWRRKRVFAGAFVEGRRLGLNIDLLRQAEHPCLHSAFNTTRRVVTHRLRLGRPEDLDAALAALVAEAYEQVGPGTRSSP